MQLENLHCRDLHLILQIDYQRMSKLFKNDIFNKIHQFQPWKYPESSRFLKILFSLSTVEICMKIMKCFIKVCEKYWETKFSQNFINAKLYQCQPWKSKNPVFVNILKALWKFAQNS